MEKLKEQLENERKKSVNKRDYNLLINGVLSITVVKHVISQMYHITINKIGIVNPI